MATGCGGQAPSAGDLRTRVDGAVALLGELGGLAEVEEQDGGYVILGCSCPLAAAVKGHPETCLLAETLLADVIGAPVRQTCDPEGPRCRFELGPLTPFKRSRGAVFRLTATFASLRLRSGRRCGRLLP